ncbi:SCO family protein [Streptomyces sp. NPDC047028]|uniref:SCO family protein n=1 Tax=Streptomyces sp. NPDC047028 TaxID=3155793 RepID=UPI0033E7387F
MRSSSARRISGVAAFVTAPGFALPACSGPSSGGTAATVVSGSGAHATSGVDSPDPPDVKPSLTPTDQNGHRYDLVKQTAGRRTRWYFGYTHWPDVCPTTMADIALAAHRLPAAGRHRLRMFFVSTDPDRDTPGSLKQWLGAIHPDFTGLTGDFSAVRRAARSPGVGISRPVRHKDGSETVSHRAEAIVFSPRDDEAHFFYTVGTSERRYAADLSKFIKGETP